LQPKQNNNAIRPACFLPKNAPTREMMMMMIMEFDAPERGVCQTIERSAEHGRALAGKRETGKGKREKGKAPETSFQGRANVQHRNCLPALVAKNNALCTASS
jgi:hypothetical protein